MKPAVRFTAYPARRLLRRGDPFMKTMLRALFAAGLLLVIAGTTVYAGTFTYDWSLGPIFVASNGNNNEVDFANKGLSTANGSTGSIAVSVLSLGSSQNADWTNKSYTFRVNITDGAHSGHVDLSGHFTGHLVGGLATWTSSFSAAPSPLILGSDKFTAAFDSFTGPASATEKGVLRAHIALDAAKPPHDHPPIDQRPGPQTNDTPEPATLLLASVGAGTAGIAAWRRRERRRTQGPASQHGP
jgi:hypothetical protein